METLSNQGFYVTALEPETDMVEQIQRNSKLVRIPSTSLQKQWSN